MIEFLFEKSNYKEFSFDNQDKLNIDWILVDYYGIPVSILHMIIVLWLCRKMFLFLDDTCWTIEIYIPCCLQLIFKCLNTDKEKCVCVRMHACVVWAKNKNMHVCTCRHASVYEYKDKDGETANVFGKLPGGE